MRIRYLVVPVIALVMALSGIAWASSSTEKTTKPVPKPVPASCKAQAFKAFSAKVWDHDKWQRGMPKAIVLDAYKKRLGCAPPGHKKAMKHRWRTDKKSYFRHRSNELFRVRVTPYYGCTTLGGCKWWAIPSYIVDCESGGDYTPDQGLTFGGAYGMLVSTWLEYGGGRWASQANYASPKAQDIVAHRLWVSHPYGPWACA